MPKGMARNDIYNLYVCSDCGYFLANGMPDEHDPTWSPDNMKISDGYIVVNGDSDKDKGFSWSPCDICDSKLGGARMHCVMWKEKES